MKIIARVCSIAIGITFIMSGFSKAVDPWGTAIKFDEYFGVYGVDFLSPISHILAIWLCGAELMMGCMMLFRVRLRLISIFALASMSIFTVITILSVTFMPIEDCGCFGEALYLTPMQTLAKNLVILPMVFVVWYRYRPDRIFSFSAREGVMTLLFCVMAMGFSLYNYLNLPMIDYLPYKVGVDLLGESGADVESKEYSVTLIYRNIESGKLREFDLDDSEWHDESQWEWVETRSCADDVSLDKSSVADFALISFDGSDLLSHFDYTPEVLNLVCITDLDKLRDPCRKKLSEYINQHNQSDEITLIVTPKRLATPTIELQGAPSVEAANIDGLLLKSIMRAKSGVVEIHNGVIVSKRSCFGL